MPPTNTRISSFLLILPWLIIQHSQEMLHVNQRASSIALNGIEHRADNYFPNQEGAFTQALFKNNTDLS
jgi:hypothetical protein